MLSRAKMEGSRPTALHRCRSRTGRKRCELGRGRQVGCILVADAKKTTNIFQHQSSVYLGHLAAASPFPGRLPDAVNTRWAGVVAAALLIYYRQEAQLPQRNSASAAHVYL